VQRRLAWRSHTALEGGTAARSRCGRPTNSPGLVFDRADPSTTLILAGSLRTILELRDVDKQIETYDVGKSIR
jgi:hypothetical protein